MNIIKLTSIGFERDTEGNFSDDGHYFWGYTYKGMKFSYLKDTESKLLFLSYHMSPEVRAKVENSVELSNQVMDLGNKFNGVEYEQITKQEIKDTMDELYELVSKL